MVDEQGGWPEVPSPLLSSPLLSSHRARRMITRIYVTSYDPSQPDVRPLELLTTERDCAPSDISLPAILAAFTKVKRGPRKPREGARP